MLPHGGRVYHMLFAFWRELGLVPSSGAGEGVDKPGMQNPAPS